MFVMMLALRNLIYRLNTIPIKIPANYFMGINKLPLQFIWRGKKPKQLTLKEKNKVGGLTLLDFKTYYKVT